MNPYLDFLQRIEAVSTPMLGAFLDAMADQLETRGFERDADEVRNCAERVCTGCKTRRGATSTAETVRRL